MEVPLAIVMLLLPAVAVTFGHVPVLPVVLTVIAPGAAGRASVKMALVVIATPFVLPIVIVTEVLPPGAKKAAPNALVTVGGVYTLTSPKRPRIASDTRDERSGSNRVGVGATALAVTLTMIVQPPAGITVHLPLKYFCFRSASHLGSARVAAGLPSSDPGPGAASVNTEVW